MPGLMWKRFLVVAGPCIRRSGHSIRKPGASACAISSACSLSIPSSGEYPTLLRTKGLPRPKPGRVTQGISHTPQAVNAAGIPILNSNHAAFQSALSGMRVRVSDEHVEMEDYRGTHISRHHRSSDFSQPTLTFAGNGNLSAGQSSPGLYVFCRESRTVALSIPS